MKKQFLSILLLSVSAFFITSCSIPSKKENEEQKTEMKDPLDVKIYTLDNGLKVYISVNKDAPRVQTAIAVRAGSKNDPSDATGLAHYLEHMLFKGTSTIATINWEKESHELNVISDLYEKRRTITDSEKRKRIYAQIDSVSQIAASYAVPNELDKLVSAMGGKGTNAFTSKEQTVYINDIPANEMDRWLKLESVRFQELTLRLFHTELEAVYEEYNRGLDSDFRKVFQTLESELFKKHTYGTQTTIGTGEHLKNPSMEKIHHYFDTYYVPNNIAICLAGDLDPDATFEKIKKYFDSWKSKEVPVFNSPVEAPIAAPIEREVAGPQQEIVALAYRLPGIESKDVATSDVFTNILSNGKAGLMDLNLNNAQKVLSASASLETMKDYSELLVFGTPREGQSLKEVKDLMLEQIEKIKKGEFEDWLVEAVINDMEVSKTKSYEKNFNRAMEMVNAFILGEKWTEVVNYTSKLRAVTKADVVKFANENFKNNYVVVNKIKGERKTIKVEKPHITPLDIDRSKKSKFAEEFEKMPSTRLKPLFIDYKTAIKNEELNHQIPYAYIENKTNNLFSLYYILDMGSDNDKKMALAIDYLPFLGTSKYTSDQLKEEFYKLGLSFDVFASGNQIYVTMDGLESSLEKGIELFEHILSDVQGDSLALANMVDGLVKERANNKLSKGYILRGAMTAYAKYGKDSEFKNILSKEDLKTVKTDELTAKIKELTSFKHRVFYYGSENMAAVKAILNKYHKTPKTFKNYPIAKDYPELDMTENKVYFVNYDMVQAEMMMISKSQKFNKEMMPQASIFNEYFGAGLSSIVFQEIREAKALAYSAYCFYSTPRRKDKSHYIQAYVGTQANKLKDAKVAILELMNNMPEAEGQFNDAKISSLKKIESERITKTSIFWNYERLKKQGIDYDIRKDFYTEIAKMTMTDLKKFFDTNIKGKKYTYLVIGNKNNVDMNVLKSMGAVKELSLEEIFGY